MSHDIRRDVPLVFILALATRWLGVGVTTLTRLNPYSLADANSFARAASEYAVVMAHGEVPVVRFSVIDDVWGVMLSPFWLLPGPSRVYARMGLGVLGALAAYNVYVIARHHHSRQAGLLAVAPLLFFPSLVLAHASVLRDVVVLFGITTAARLLLAPLNDLPRYARYSAAVGALGLATVLRTDNLPVYLLVVGVAVVLSVRQIRESFRSWPVTVGAGVAVGGFVIVPVAREVIEYLARIRGQRASGRTEYLGWVFPDTVVEAIAFSWIGVAYFLFSPFPWMASTPSDFVVGIEAMITLGFSIAAFSGARVMARQTVPGTVALVVGILVASVLYGLGTANVGTAVRHRQMITWALFVLGGIGLSNRVDLVLTGHRS